MAIEYRWAEDQFDRLPELAAELVRRQVAVIAATGGTAAALAAKAATRRFPSSSSPPKTRSGLVLSPASPGRAATLTGINFFVPSWRQSGWSSYASWCPPPLAWPCSSIRPMLRYRDHFERRRSGCPRHRAANPGSQRQHQPARSMRPSQLLRASGPTRFSSGATPFFTAGVSNWSTLATRHAIPTTYAAREFAEAGGLMSYGSQLPDAYRQVGVYVGRILKGAKPADLPVVQSTKFELVINAQTARMLGLDVPPTLLARADEVIE